MSTLEDLDEMERDGKEDNQDDGEKNKKRDSHGHGDADVKNVDSRKKKDEGKVEDETIDAEILNMSTRDIIARRRLLENDTRIMKSEWQRLNHEKQAMHDKIKDNVEKIDNNR